MQIKKNFDVKIKIVFPYLTKNMSDKDSERISRSTLFKYKPQESIASPQMVSQSEISEEKDDKDLALELIKRLKNIYDGLADLKKIARRGLKDIVYRYDVKNPENEQIYLAEEGLFGIPTGEITLNKYESALQFKSLIEKEVTRRALAKGVENEVAA